MAEPFSSERPVRWGVAATGKISAILVEEIRRTPGCEVSAVGSRTIEAAELFATKHGIDRAYGSYAALVEDDEIDVVYVGASHSAHFTIARECIELGRPVLCEKPLTVDSRQAESLVALARARRIFLMEAMWMRCRPGFRQLGEALSSGAIGEVRTLHAELGFVPSLEDQGGRLYDPAQAGGALLDVGIYPVTLAYSMFGPPTESRAVAHLSRGVDLSVSIAMSWASGKTALLGASLEAASDRTAVFAGSEGRIDVSAPFHQIESFTVVPLTGAPRMEVPASEGFGYVHEIEEVVRCLRLGLTESPLVPLDDSVGVMRILDECRRQIGLQYPAAALA